jgi:amino acid transporter
MPDETMVAGKRTGVQRAGSRNGRKALPRVLGLASLTFYGVGLILGAGIYSILGQAAGIAGEELWLSFLIGSLAALLTGLSYAELATMFPQAGAEYVYAREAWPRLHWLPGTLGWVLTIAGIATTATVALAFAGYASQFVAAPTWAIATALIVASGALNIIGITEASWTNVVFTLIEAAGLVALIVVGVREPDFFQVFSAAPHAGVLGGAGLIFFAYLGFEEIANLAEEAKNPSRDLPLAILIAVAVTTTLYVLVAAVSVTLLDPAKLAASSSPLADAMREGAPQFAGALGGVALFATANTAIITITAVSRLLFGMARGGDAPAMLSGTLAQRQTPAAAIMLGSIGTLVFLPLGSIGLVGSVASLLALVAFAVVNGALVWLRVSRPEMARPFRVPLAVKRVPVLAVLGLLVVLALVTQFEAMAYGIAAITLALAAVGRALPLNRSPGQKEHQR